MATLDFKGKSIIQNYHMTVKYHEIVPQKAKSLTKAVSLDDNLIIHGDNLKALKALLPMYAGKVKCIYIDPPYNTGNESWAYNDNVNSPMMQEWLKEKVVDKDDLTRHDKWLCLMTPRLKLIRELMNDSGVILISIDDNEQHRLRSLLDEIFGEENFVANIVWEKIHSSKNDAKYFSENHEYLLVYAKKIEKICVNLLERTEEMNNRYSNPDDDSRGPWASGDLVANEVRKDGAYEVKSPSGKTFNVPSGKHWVYSQENMLTFIKENRIWFGKDDTAFPRLKRFLSEVQQGRKAGTIWLNEEVGHNQEAKREIRAIFSEKEAAVFTTPKPVRLINQVLKLFADKDDIVLDSFAGSGTTAHAVLSLNNEDHGNRKFILIECEDYADTITAERVRKAIKGIPKSPDESLKKSLGGSFSYFELGKPIEMEGILSGKSLPSYKELARYVFYTATGEEFNEKNIDEKKQFIGESKEYEVYLFYKPNIDTLKKTALTLERAEALGKPKTKRRLVFAPTKYMNNEQLAAHKIDFAQLPFEIYKFAE
ncbi:MAG: site-specific DNA-methyltransferase [Candidatus Omnitrophica bacterium]|nr:site-specific DNA-methyltransferase [Candidatus Omnitrophota bacterium]